MKSAEEIKKLLQRYYDGATTLQEETELRNWFQSAKSVPEELSAEKALFEMTGKALEEQLSDNAFEEKILTTIGKKNKRKSIMMIISAVAAGWLLFFTLNSGLDIFNTKPLPGTVNNPQLAFSNAKQALFMISSTLNKGLKPTHKAAATINMSMKITGEINKVALPVKELRQVNRIKSAADMMQSFSLTKKNNNQFNNH